MSATDTKNRKTVVLAVVGILVTALTVFFIWLALTSSSCSRTVSRWEAEYGRGVDRVVTLYSATGEEIGTWQGIIDVSYETDRVDLLFFDENGAVIDRVVITPGSGTLVVDQV